jgi:signal transduction histidine kinase
MVWGTSVDEIPMHSKHAVSDQTAELRDPAAELRRTVAELAAAQRIKDEFLSLVSHELRIPLTSIRGYTELLQDEELPDEQRMCVDVIDKNADRLLGLVDDLLLMTQIRSGGLPLELQEIDLSNLLARSAEEARALAANKQVDVDVDTGPRIKAQGDAARLEQAFDNLLSNAIKCTPPGGGVTITMSHTGPIATIAVGDTGIGIPMDEQDQVFGHFFRTSNALAAGLEGRGLGLAIARGIVEAHGGTIGFESREGEGTTFSITLPCTHVA